MISTKEFISEWKRVKETWNKQLKTVIKNRPVMFGTHRLNYFVDLIESIGVSETLDGNIAFNFDAMFFNTHDVINMIKAFIKKIDDVDIIFNKDDYENIYDDQYIVYDGNWLYPTYLESIDNDYYFSLDDDIDEFSLFSRENFEREAILYKFIDKKIRLYIECLVNDKIVEVRPLTENEIDIQNVIDDVIDFIKNENKFLYKEYHEVDTGLDTMVRKDIISFNTGKLHDLDTLDRYIIMGVPSPFSCELTLYTPKQ